MEEWTYVTYKKKKTKETSNKTKEQSNNAKGSSNGTKDQLNEKKEEVTSYRWADEEFPEPLRYKCGKQFSSSYLLNNQ